MMTLLFEPAHSRGAPSRPLDDAHAAGTGDHGGMRQPDEQAVLDHPGNAVETIRQRSRIRNAFECRVEYPVPAIRDESVAVPGAAQQRRSVAISCRDRGGDRAPCRRQSERHDLDRQREAPERRDPFGFVGDDDHACGSRGDDLFPQQCAAAALDQAQVAGNLVGAIDREIQLGLFRDYKNNLDGYPAFQQYFRDHRPPVLIVWGRNDEIFGPNGAEAYVRDLPDAELHLLDTGHFALEEDVDFIAEKIRDFLGRHVG